MIRDRDSRDDGVHQLTPLSAAAPSLEDRSQSCNPSSEGPGNADAGEQLPVLASAPRILDRVAEALEEAMVVGEPRAKKLLYLVVTSRLLERPVSVVIKGPSAAGKSFLAEQVLRLFPPDAYHQLTAMSEKALAYSRVPLHHRILVLFEAAGLRGEFASYLVRSLLSEGHVRYETVERTSKGLQPRLIVREGPTGLITTTTAVHLHPENETRMLSLTIADTPAQTAAVMRALAAEPREIDLTPFHDLQRWLASGELTVLVPYAGALASLIPPVAVRLRRDFATLTALIRAHALLHQATRPRSDGGAVLAGLDDYAVVRELVADLVAEGVKAAVPTTMRETVDAISALAPGPEQGCSVASLARRLGLDESAAFRRARAAIDRGYLRNLEDRPRRPARLILGEPLPEEVVVLPPVERLQDCIAEETEDPSDVGEGVPG
jgi:hypothetical protein